MIDFAAVLCAFEDVGVESIVVGGLAATIHGSARLTQDVDLVYSREPRNLERLADALRPHSPYLRGAPEGLPFEWSVATITRGLNFTLTTAIGDIDLLGEIPGGGDYQALLPHTNGGGDLRAPLPLLEPACAHPRQTRRWTTEGPRRVGGVGSALGVWGIAPGQGRQPTTGAICKVISKNIPTGRQ